MSGRRPIEGQLLERTVDNAPRAELLGPEKTLEVGFTPDEREIVINFPADGRDTAHHVVFSPAQARYLAKILMRKASECKQ